MSTEFSDYSAVESRQTDGIRLLSIYSNRAEGLLTVSRISGVLAGYESSKTVLLEALQNLVSGEAPQDAGLEVLTLAQLLDKVEQFYSSLGGVAACGLILSDAPEELCQALEATGAIKIADDLTNEDIDRFFQ